MVMSIVVDDERRRRFEMKRKWLMKRARRLNVD